MENNIVNQPGPDFETDGQKQNQVVNEQEQNKAVNGGDTFQNTQSGNTDGTSGGKSDDFTEEQEGSGDSEIETPAKKEDGSAEKTEKKIPNY